jgi:hypothetical protein
MALSLGEREKFGSLCWNASSGDESVECDDMEEFLAGCLHRVLLRARHVIPILVAVKRDQSCEMRDTAPVRAISYTPSAISS